MFSGNLAKQILKLQRILAASDPMLGIFALTEKYLIDFPILTHWFSRHAKSHAFVMHSKRGFSETHGFTLNHTVSRLTGTTSQFKLDTIILRWPYMHYHRMNVMGFNQIQKYYVR